MLKIMTHIRAELLWVFAIIISGSLLSWLFFNREGWLALLALQRTPVSINVNLARNAQTEFGTTLTTDEQELRHMGGNRYGKPDSLVQINGSLRSNEYLRDVVAVDGVRLCSECADRIATVLTDFSESQERRISAGRFLIEKGLREGTLAVLYAIYEAHDSGQYDLKDGLMQALADTQSPDSIKVLIDVITGNEKSINFSDLPEDIQYAVRKAVRRSPNDQETGAALAQRFVESASTDVAEYLEGVGHPEMITVLAARAFAEGDMSEVDARIQSLVSVEDPRTVDGLMHLGAQGVVSPEEASRLAYDWVLKHRESIDVGRFSAYLSDSRFNSVQRSIAAFAVAAWQDRVAARSALEEAYLREDDIGLRASIQAAINEIPAPDER